MRYVFRSIIQLNPKERTLRLYHFGDIQQLKSQLDFVLDGWFQNGSPSEDVNRLTPYEFDASWEEHIDRGQHVREISAMNSY